MLDHLGREAEAAIGKASSSCQARCHAPIGFANLTTPAAPIGQARRLSLEGARMLAAELRDAVARRHALAVARVGRDRTCCFDLHVLVPAPGDILRLGPDHPEALQWLWTHWGTTDALRRVVPAPDRDETAPVRTVWRISFWSADWTPWRALATIRGRFPELRFDVQPHYERG